MTDAIDHQIFRDLEQLSALFEHPDDKQEFLTQIVERIHTHVGVALAAIFVFSPDDTDLVLGAACDLDGRWDGSRFTDDEHPERFSIDDSAVGRAFRDSVVVRKQPDPQHAAYGSYTLAEKLIAPLARGPQRFGVLVLGATEPGAFARLTDSDVMRLASRIGDELQDASILVSHARRLGELPDVIKGRRASHGAAVGRAVLFWSDFGHIADSYTGSGDPATEKQRFDHAVNASMEQLRHLEEGEVSGIPEVGSLIFGAHRMMLRDKSFIEKIRSRIRAGEQSAAAVETVVEEYADRFSRMNEARIAEKAQDVRDLGYRLITNLHDGTDREFTWSGRIALARHVFPSDLARLAVEGVAGIVLIGTGVTAHISILASSLGVPVLITDDHALLMVADDTTLVLDADGERLMVDPSEEVVDQWEHKIARTGEMPTSFILRGRTADRHAVQVMGNVNLVKDAIEARTQGAEGIGLYRSEFPFILKNDFLSEEQQYRIYRSVVMSQRGKPVDLRTADIGGDKLLQGRGSEEENPFLGVRGIRFSLANREMFGDQLRAILRAGADADLGIMLPMVSGVEEVLEAREEIERAKSQLSARNASFNRAPRVGAMVELPAAAISTRELSEATDFLSIGTNDLTMYLLAVDRTNEHLSHLYRTYHPTVLRTIAGIARDAAETNTPVSVCGDAAADPLMTRFFVGIGITKLSVAPGYIEPIKRTLFSYALSEAEGAAREMLAIKRVTDMERYVQRAAQGVSTKRTA